MIVSVLSIRPHGILLSTVNDVTGEDFNWFFDQVLYGTNVLDYKVNSISSKRIPEKPLGIFGDPLEELMVRSLLREEISIRIAQKNRRQYIKIK